MLLVHFDLILLINNDMMQYVMWYCSYEVAMSCKPGQKTNIVEQAIYKTAKCFARKRESNKDHHVCSAVFEVVNI